MAKKNARRRVEYVQRIVKVKAVQMHVSHRIDDRGRWYRPGGYSWLRVCGTFDEPLEGQSNVEISIHEPEDEQLAHDPTKSIGGLVQLKPHVQFVIDMPSALFERTWGLAAGGRLLFGWISMTKPRGRYSAVVSVSFTNEADE